MQKIFFHKTVHLEYPLKELLSISVDESIHYKMEVNGMRAMGSIMIHGEYDDGQKRNHFNENIDLDLLAQFDKIEDKRDFHMKVEDFDYSIAEGVLKLVIQTHIYGVKDDQDKHIHVNDERIIEEAEVIEPHIESLLREEDQKEMIEELKEDVKDVVEQAVPLSQIIEPEKKVEKVEEDEDDDIGTYYFYIVQDGDSYSSISSRYDMDENIVKEYNRHREVKEGNIIIIPYLP